jgi:hypothetical protein
VPGSCPNLHNDQVLLQYRAIAVAPVSNNNAANQPQQCPTLLNTQSSIAQDPNNVQGPSHPTSGLRQRPLAINQNPQPNVNQQQLVPLERHVFMTSKVSGHCLLSQWDTLTPRPQNDREFFRKLRECYMSSRGLWRRYFGLKVFSHCEFYRVSYPSKRMSCLTQM